MNQQFLTGLHRPIPGGLLVAVEGIDGAGKTSVSSLLAQWCGERGIACTISKEPTGLRWGNELRQSAREGRLTLQRELELFELDRRDHVERSINPALGEGNVVILDRYYWSSAAYQGARGINHDEIMSANEKFAPIPDIVLVLDVAVAEGLRRIRARGDTPNSFEGESGLSRARDIFRLLAASRENARIVDASGDFRNSYSEALQHFVHAGLAKIANGVRDLDDRERRLRTFNPSVDGTES